MRVQPHLPSKPLLATVMSSSKFALCACSAANSPAPPEPRIRMSVLRCSMLMPPSKHAHEERQSDHGGHGSRERSKLLLPVAPIEILDQEDAQAAEQMDGEQEHESDLGELHQGPIGPAQKILKSRFTLDSETQHQKMQRQENRERKPRDPMNHRGQPQCAAAML